MLLIEFPFYSLFQEYKTCSQPFFMNCDQETLTEFHILDSAFSPICGHLAAGRSSIRILTNDYHQLSRLFVGVFKIII